MELMKWGQEVAHCCMASFAPVGILSKPKSCPRCAMAVPEAIGIALAAAVKGTGNVVSAV